ncbi:acetylxylan esterase [Microlunatus endophyticus]|uniref:Acetylxylan esterase n=1 Tax=Microlunatus endophyticus TaxID=1716077 RepID=A0A917S6F1_9ACTN|nr:acetylxylan esterase [Microlunatus endophyticus]GGL59331.1 acetylxylan esterase [Microlunatus endophyticus]
MAQFDMALDQLQAYRPTVAEPDDFDEFWTSTLTEAGQFDLDPTFVKIETGTPVFDTYDLTFSGFGGTRVKGWFITPAGAEGPLPTVVEYLGYSGGRGLPFSRQTFAAAGWAYVIMDTRGQGWASGGYESTPDLSSDAGLHHTPGFMTAGLTDPKAYYYRRVYTDTVRCLEAVRGNPLVDSSKIVVTGGSQGGGLSIAAAGLAPYVGIDLAGCAPNVPFLSHFARAIQITDRDPYHEITRYLAGWRDLVPVAYRTLSYFDGVNLGKRAKAPALFSVGLMDLTCPPSTVYAAYNFYGEDGGNPEKSIDVYTHNDHEGGGDYNTGRRLEWFAELFA